MKDCKLKHIVYSKFCPPWEEGRLRIGFWMYSNFTPHYKSQPWSLYGGVTTFLARDAINSSNSSFSMDGVTRKSTVTLSSEGTTLG